MIIGQFIKSRFNLLFYSVHVIESSENLTFRADVDVCLCNEVNHEKGESCIFSHISIHLVLAERLKTKL